MRKHAEGAQTGTDGARVRCEATTRAGTPCRAPCVHGTTRCLSHATSRRLRAKHRSISAQGGRNRRHDATLPPLAALLPSTTTLDAAGIVRVLSATLARLGELPFTTNVAFAIAATSNAARSALETSDLEARLRALEAQAEMPDHAPLRRA